MMKVALIIIYNHQYNKNIDILEKIYKGRFSNIYHLVPFYEGEKDNVIPVYDCSYYFQGYVAQGVRHFFKDDYTHYFFIADDLFINPLINENNYSEHLKLTASSCFIPGFISLHKRENFWVRIVEAYLWNIKLPGVEAINQLPTYENAIERFRHFDLEIKPLRYDQIYSTPSSLKNWVIPFFSSSFFKHSSIVFKYLMHKIKKKKYVLSYPIVGSYSDIFVISSETIKQFSHYCGVFSATKLFVEFAIPTSLVLSAKEIITEKDLALQGKALWSQAAYQELVKFNKSLKLLIAEFPRKYLYLHAIKLSKWNTEL